MRLPSLACTLALGLASSIAHAAQPVPATPAPAAQVPGSEAIVSKTLANGLTLIVWPDHDIPNANYYTFYKVGSRNEHAGITGLAHFFEHMMFNGTTRRAPSVDNDNMGTLMEQMQATAWLAHPYHIPTIGWPSDIERWKSDDLKAFFKTYYAPNNAVLVIAGDVEPAQVLQLADQYLAPLPQQAAPPAVTTVEPEQLGERRVVVERADAQSPILAYAFHSGIGAGSPQYPALELLTSILAEGDSSRLHQRLVEREQLAVAAGAFAEAGFDPGLLWVYAMLPPGGDPAKVETVLDDELARIARDGVSAAELTKARNLQLAGFWQQMATINGKAQLLGEYAVFHGDYRKAFAAPAAFEAVTAADVQALAKSILRKQNRTTGLVQPVAATAHEEATR